MKKTLALLAAALWSSCASPEEPLPQNGQPAITSDYRKSVREDLRQYVGFEERGFIDGKPVHYKIERHITIGFGGSSLDEIWEIIEAGEKSYVDVNADGLVDILLLKRGDGPLLKIRESIPEDDAERGVLLFQRVYKEMDIGRRRDEYSDKHL